MGPRRPNSDPSCERGRPSKSASADLDERRERTTAAYADLQAATESAAAGLSDIEPLPTGREYLDGLVVYFEELSTEWIALAAEARAASSIADLDALDSKAAGVLSAGRSISGLSVELFEVLRDEPLCFPFVPHIGLG